MRINPILTEKSLAEASEGWYSFLVGRGFTKAEIKSALEKTFGVHVRQIRTMNYKAHSQKNLYGKKAREEANKKVLVRLAEKEKIELFETEGKKKK